jgi:hypothetical protein
LHRRQCIGKCHAATAAAAVGLQHNTLSWQESTIIKPIIIRLSSNGCCPAFKLLLLLLLGARATACCSACRCLAGRLLRCCGCSVLEISRHSPYRHVAVL